MRIGLLSDTHSHLDTAILRHLEVCDEIWHAGDIGQSAVTDQLSSIKPLRAVFGNIDDAIIRQQFPEHLHFQCEGVKVYITHIGGYPGKYPTRIRKEIIEHSPQLFICGHSHILKVIPDKQHHLLHINPGAAGQHGFHLIRTMIRFHIDEGRIHQLEVIELGKRGEIG